MPNVVSTRKEPFVWCYRVTAAIKQVGGIFYMTCGCDGEGAVFQKGIPTSPAPAPTPAAIKWTQLMSEQPLTSYHVLCLCSSCSLSERRLLSSFRVWHSSLSMRHSSFSRSTSPDRAQTKISEGPHVCLQISYLTYACSSVNHALLPPKNNTFFSYIQHCCRMFLSHLPSKIYSFLPLVSLNDPPKRPNLLWVVKKRGVEHDSCSLAVLKAWQASHKAGFMQICQNKWTFWDNWSSALFWETKRIPMLIFYFLFFFFFGLHNFQTHYMPKKIHRF